MISFLENWNRKNKTCNRLKNDRDKRQVIERAEIIKKVFGNFEEYTKQIRKKTLAQPQIQTISSVR